MTHKILISMGLLRESIELARSRAGSTSTSAMNPLAKAELMARLKDKEGLVCQITDTIDAEVLGAAARLKVVANRRGRLQHIDVAAAHRRGIVVHQHPDVLTDTTADFAWVLLMATARRVVEGGRLRARRQVATVGVPALARRRRHGKTSGSSASGGSGARSPGGPSDSTCAFSTGHRPRCRGDRGRAPRDVPSIRPYSSASPTS